MKPVDVKSSTCIDIDVEDNDKNLAILGDCQNAKIFLQKTTLQIDQKKFL